jgi:hypothetical protein
MPTRGGAADAVSMYARAIDEAQSRLLQLHREEQQQIAVAAVALAAALAATTLYEPLVVPLFAGGLAIGALGVRALWRHWDLVDRLADDCDAYGIPEVRAYAARDAQMDRRLLHAAQLRAWTREPTSARLAEVADQLDRLARALEDPERELDPARAIACRRLVSDASASPLLDTTRPLDELRAVIGRILEGFDSSAR